MKQDNLSLMDISLQARSGKTERFIKNNYLKIPVSSLYCLKALGALFVICIHCYSPKPLYPIIRTAVPFFFIISGFFLYKEDSEEAFQKCINAFKKILWITLYANIFYYICYNVPDNILPFKSLKSVVFFIATGSNLGFHLWYLTAYLETLFIIIVCIKFRMLSKLWFCIPLFILWGLLTGKYQFLVPSLPNNLLLSRNFLTMGIPGFGIGWLLRKYSSKVLNIFASPVIGALIILSLSGFEAILLNLGGGKILSGDYLITTFPLATAMMLVGLRYPTFGKDTILELIGKKYSTYIYIFHVFVYRTLRTLTNGLLEFPPITFPFIVFFLTIAFIAIWEKCSRKFF